FPAPSSPGNVRPIPPAANPHAAPMPSLTARPPSPPVQPFHAPAPAPLVRPPSPPVQTFRPPAPAPVVRPPSPPAHALPPPPPPPLPAPRPRPAPPLPAPAPLPPPRPLRAPPLPRRYKRSARPRPRPSFGRHPRRRSFMLRLHLCSAPRRRQCMRRRRCVLHPRRSRLVLRPGRGGGGKVLRSVAQAVDRLCQHFAAEHDVRLPGLFRHLVAAAANARNEQHGSGDKARHDHGVVPGTARHVHRLLATRFCGTGKHMDKRVRHRRRCKACKGMHFDWRAPA